jgi:hypothetical protein
VVALGAGGAGVAGGVAGGRFAELDVSALGAGAAGAAAALLVEAFASGEGAAPPVALAVVSVEELAATEVSLVVDFFLWWVRAL